MKLKISFLFVFWTMNSCPIPICVFKPLSLEMLIQKNWDKRILKSWDQKLFVYFWNLGDPIKIKEFSRNSIEILVIIWGLLLRFTKKIICYVNIYLLLFLWAKAVCSKARKILDMIYKWWYKKKNKKSEVIIEELYDFECVLMKNYIAGSTWSKTCCRRGERNWTSQKQFPSYPWCPWRRREKTAEGCCCKKLAEQPQRCVVWYGWRVGWVEYCSSEMENGGSRKCFSSKIGGV